jgi:hypothetical protein
MARFSERLATLRPERELLDLRALTLAGRRARRT